MQSLKSALQCEILTHNRRHNPAQSLLANIISLSETVKH